MAFATIGDVEHVVVEVKVRNALADTFGEAFAGNAAAKESAAFRTGTVITLLAVKNGQAEPLPETVVEEVANLKGAPLAARAADARYFSLPYEALQQYFRDAPILLRPRASNKVELDGQQ